MFLVINFYDHPARKSLGPQHVFCVSFSAGSINRSAIVTKMEIATKV